jgi:hypothetical protein
MTGGTIVVDEDERHHAGEADPARPEHRGQRHVAHRADDGDDRSDNHALDDADGLGRVVQERGVELVVPEQSNEAAEEEPSGDLLPRRWWIRLSPGTTTA